MQYPDLPVLTGTDWTSWDSSPENRCCRK